MITLRKSEERGQTKIDWLDSRHSFSFGDYYDPKHVSFGPLRVINEDWIAGGGGFQPHGHRDMEIVTYLIDGALQHKDSVGGGGIIRTGEIQRMSAGVGIVHSEFNASRDQPAHLLQIWITPAKSGLEPSYEQKTIAPVRNAFTRIAAPDPKEGEVRLVQDAEIWMAKLDHDVVAVHPLARGRRSWVQLVNGELELGEKVLKPGDAAAIVGESEVRLRALSASEVLLFDMA
jgi:redox-sensitive bicupin YhaK (pirin superfamily)